MTASKGSVCLQIRDGYSDYENEGNRKEMVHVMNVPIKTKRYFVFVHCALLFWNVIHVINAELDKDDQNPGPRNEI